MKDDIIKPAPVPASDRETPVANKSDDSIDGISLEPSLVQLPPDEKKPWKRRVLLTLLIVLTVAMIVAFTAWFGYKMQLQAVAGNSNEKVKVTVQPGASLAGIADVLDENGLLRSRQAFLWYVRIHGVASSLQSGTYRIAKSDDVPTIVDHLTSGKTDTFSITFYPGGTLQKHRETLIEAGYSQESVDEALNKDYASMPLFAGKPKSADLEGYIYGETYNFPPEATPEQIITRTFDQFQAVIDESNVVPALKKRGFSLYEGITLASIIQREVITKKDMAQVSQVFQLRLKRKMQLGSDVTYQYAADKLGVERDVNLDSDYNTRIRVGLPPGPIASPGIDALIAVAHPANGDFVYFLSGDDDKTYFGRTLEEHESNKRKYCQKKCQII